MILDRYLLRQVFPIFVAAIGMFVFLLSLIDLFANLFRYLNNEVPFAQIMLISAYYLPKSFSYALPIALLFASAYTLGDLYARNELTSIFSSGIPFWRFSMPLVVMGLFASVFAFFFDDTVVIPTLRRKNELSRHFLHQQPAESNTDIVIKANNGQLIYSVDYYDYTERILNNVLIIELDDGGNLISHVRTPKASWAGEHWELLTPIIYFWDETSGMLRYKSMEPTDKYREKPEIFRRHAVRPEELSVWEERLLIEDLKSAGLPFMEAQADYYHRFSYSTVPFIVMILSISMGGRFKKNILLMSLLSSLSAAVVFYVMEMLTMMLAKMAYIPALVGAWFPVMVFIIIGLLLLKGAKT